MKFTITFNNMDCSGEPWDESFDEPEIKNLDDANDFARGYVKGCATCGARVRVLIVTVVLSMLDLMGGPWED